MDTREIQNSAERIEALVQEIERIGDPVLQGQVQEIVQALLEYHSAGLRRILEIVDQTHGGAALEQFAKDELVSSLLLLYDLHPKDIRTRIEEALDTARPYLKSHGGQVELVDVSDTVVRLRLQGSCHGCPSSAATMKSRIEEAVFAAAPDIVKIELEGENDAATSVTPAGFVPLGTLSGRSSNGQPAQCNAP